LKLAKIKKKCTIALLYFKNILNEPNLETGKEYLCFAITLTAKRML